MLKIADKRTIENIENIAKAIVSVRQTTAFKKRRSY